jgi:hypothetical protein
MPGELLTTDDCGQCAYPSGDGAGSTLTSGDWNGDGYDNLAASNKLDSDAGNGAIVVWMSLGPTTGRMNAQGLPLRWLGGDHGNGIGATLAATGDLDGDGVREILVGQEDDWSTDADNERVFVVGSTQLPW